MVEGDDLFGKGYKIFSKNFPAYPIENIQLLQNYTSNPHLKGIESSNKTALNLELKEKAKATLFGNINAGFDPFLFGFYKARINISSFSSKNKYYLVGVGNSIGTDNIGDIDDYLRNDTEDKSNSEILENPLNLSAPVLNFSRERYTFNDEKTISVNSIFNPSNKFKIKVAGFLDTDNQFYSQLTEDRVVLPDTSFVNLQNAELKKNRLVSSGKIEASYEFTKNSNLKYTGQYTNIDIDDSSNLIFNNVLTNESLENDNPNINQSVLWSIRLNEKEALQIQSKWIEKKTSTNYFTDQFFFEELFPSDSTVNGVIQSLRNQFTFLELHGHYLHRENSGNLLELSIGSLYRKDLLRTRFSLLEENSVIDVPEGFQNNTLYILSDNFFESKYSVEAKNLSLFTKIDFHYLLTSIQNNNLKNSRSLFYVNPTLGLNWKIDSENKILTSFSLNRRNAKIFDVNNGFIANNFRLFSRGTGNFNQINGSTLLFNYQLGNWVNRFFGYSSFIYIKENDFFSTNTTINQDFILTETAVLDDREFLSATSDLNYFFKKLRNNLKGEFSFSQTSFKNIVNESELREITNSNFTFGVELRSAFKGTLNYHLGSEWKVSDISGASNSNFRSSFSFFDLTITSRKNIDLGVKTERYSFTNSRSNTEAFYFSDIYFDFKTKNKDLSFSLTGRNLFNVQNYRTISINDIESTFNEFLLLPRIILLNLEYRF